MFFEHYGFNGINLELTAADNLRNLKILGNQIVIFFNHLWVRRRRSHRDFRDVLATDPKRKAPVLVDEAAISYNSA